MYHHYITTALSICFALMSLHILGQPKSPVSNPSTPTPVVLTFFQGKHHQKQYNELLWQTAQEINAAYFSIEKSTDGIHFRGLGRVSAGGNKDTPTDYRFLDKEYSGLNYYRLRQVDFDSSFYYSPVISIEGAWVNIQSQNPFREALSIEVNATTAWSWKIAGISGKQLYHGSSTEHLLQLNTKKWPVGVYFLEIWFSTVVWSKRLIKE